MKWILFISLGLNAYFFSQSLMESVNTQVYDEVVVEASIPKVKKDQVIKRSSSLKKTISDESRSKKINQENLDQESLIDSKPREKVEALDDRSFVEIQEKFDQGLEDIFRDEVADRSLLDKYRNLKNSFQNSLSDAYSHEDNNQFDFFENSVQRKILDLRDEYHQNLEIQLGADLFHKLNQYVKDFNQEQLNLGHSTQSPMILMEL